MTETRASASAPAGPLPAQAGLIPSLVGIRGVFATLIVAIHLSPYGLGLVPVLAPIWAAVGRNGYLGQDMFFILSGFVVTTGYRTRFARLPRLAVYGRFLWARLARFYPVYIAVLAALAAAALVGPLVGVDVPHGGDFGVDLARSVLLTQGWGGADSLNWNGPTWSLSVEWLCYLLMPLIVPAVLWLRRPTVVVVGYLVVAFLPVFVYGLIGYDDAHITYIAPMWRGGAEFLAGALLCQLGHVGSRWPERMGRLTGLVVVATLALMTVLGVLGATQLWAVPMAGLIVLGLAQRRGAIDRFLSTGRMLAAGDLSVSLFLTHVPWLFAASQIITPQRFPGAWGWLGVLLMITGAVVVSLAARRLIERPAQKAMARMVRRSGTPDVVPAVQVPAQAPPARRHGAGAAHRR